MSIHLVFIYQNMRKNVVNNNSTSIKKNKIFLFQFRFNLETQIRRNQAVEMELTKLFIFILVGGTSCLPFNPDTLNHSMRTAAAIWNRCSSLSTTNIPNSSRQERSYLSNP